MIQYMQHLLDFTIFFNVQQFLGLNKFPNVSKQPTAKNVVVSYLCNEIFKKNLFEESHSISRVSFTFYARSSLFFAQLSCQIINRNPKMYSSVMSLFTLPIVIITKICLCFKYVKLMCTWIRLTYKQLRLQK